MLVLLTFAEVLPKTLDSAYISNLHNKFHTARASGSLVIVVKQKSKD